MKRNNRAIANIKNPIGRRLLLALVSVIAGAFVLIIVVYAVFAALWKGLTAIGSEFSYHIAHTYNILKNGYIYAWMGHEAYEAKLEEIRKARNA